VKKILRYSNLPRQLASFSFVGLCSNLIGYVAYLLLVANDMDPKLAVTLLYFIGVLVSYLGNKRLTFRETGNFLSSGARYLAVYIMGYLLNIFLIFLFVDRLGFPHQIVQAIAILLVAIVLFFMLRIFVFRSNSSSIQR
jgi:putative flippase GtrA